MFMIVERTAHPEENAIPYLAYSKAAIYSSRAALVGFPHLV